MDQVDKTTVESKSIKIDKNNMFICPNLKTIPYFNHRIKIGVLASGNGTNFESLVRSIKDNKLNAEISILIVNQANCQAINRAINLNIPHKTITHSNCSREEHDQLIVNKLKEYDVELVVMAGWMRIVGDELINHFRNRLINVHPSILPCFKGVDAIQQAIDKKVKISGCTVHHVVKEVDSGEIIIQAAIPIDSNDKYDSIKYKIQLMEHRILPIAVGIVAQQITKDYG